MAKGKGRNIYNVENLNVEIDYEKLANAIVEAQTKARVKKKKDNFRAKAMQFFNGVFFGIVAVISVSGIFAIWKDCFPNKTIPLYGCVILTGLFAFVGIYALLCQQETFDDDSDESISHFNTNVALLALIIALVAMWKGVN